MFKSVSKIHFVGIGGIGMSGIAEILINQGFKVSGSDLNESSITENLKSLGATIFKGHSAENVEGVDVVVFSSAVNTDENPETAEAKHRKIPLIRRAEMLAEVSRLNYSIAVAGTHGKTTTTSMLGLVLIKAGIDPTVIVGGRLKDFGGTNARLGKGDWTVVEADEFDRSFLQLTPTISIVNNIEEEHLDVYRDIEDIEETFSEFANKVPFYGFTAMCMDDDGVKNIIPNMNKKIRTYGFSRNCDIRGDEPEYKDRAAKCKVYEGDNLLGELEIQIPGEHNLTNALAAVTVARALEIEFSVISSALKEFEGVFRRFEHKGEWNGVTVIDDYAHHPTECEATLKGASNGFDGRVICLFQPHTYTRTRDQYKEFARSFNEADVLVVMDVYPAREKPIEGINGELIADSAIQYGHKNVVYIPDENQVKEKLKTILQEGDMLITMGAGSVWKIGEELIKENV